MFKIIWTDEAIEQQVDILNYWFEHNKSSKYSEKILIEIEEFETLLEINPFIGNKTDFKEVRRVIILNNFSLFYKIIEKNVYIVAARDNRRNPDTLKI